MRILVPVGQLMPSGGRWRSTKAVIDLVLLTWRCDLILNLRRVLSVLLFLSEVGATLGAREGIHQNQLRDSLRMIKCYLYHSQEYFL